MFVSEIMSKCVTECTEDAGLEEVYDLIRKCEHGFVVVVDSHAHRVPIGVVSERSICEQIIVRGRNPKTLFAGAVLDSKIKRVSQTDLVESLDVADLTLTAIVVTDSNRQVCGLIPNTIVRAIATRGLQSCVPNDARGSQSADEIPAFGWVQ